MHQNQRLLWNSASLHRVFITGPMHVILLASQQIHHGSLVHHKGWPISWLGIKDQYSGLGALL